MNEPKTQHESDTFDSKMATHYRSDPAVLKINEKAITDIPRFKQEQYRDLKAVNLALVRKKDTGEMRTISDSDIDIFKKDGWEVINVDKLRKEVLAE